MLRQRPRRYSLGCSFSGAETLCFGQLSCRQQACAEHSAVVRSLGSGLLGTEPRLRHCRRTCGAERIGSGGGRTRFRSWRQGLFVCGRGLGDTWWSLCGVVRSAELEDRGITSEAYALKFLDKGGICDGFPRRSVRFGNGEWIDDQRGGDMCLYTSLTGEAP